MIDEEELPVSAMYKIIRKAGEERVSESGFKELEEVGVTQSLSTPVMMVP